MDNETRAKFRTLFHRNQNPTFVLELQSQEVLYLNPAMEQLLGGRSKDDIIHRPYYDIISDENTDPIHHKTLMGDHHEYKIYDNSLRQQLSVSHVYINVNESLYDINTYVCEDSFQNPRSNHSVEADFEQAMTQCIQVLQRNDSSVIPTFLEILGNYYQAEKSYLYLIERNTQHIPCLHYWRKNNTINVTQDLSQIMDANRLFQWFDLRNEVGMLEAAVSHSGQEEDQVGSEILKVFHLENIVLSMVEDSKHNPIAMVIVSNRSNTEADYRLLQAVSKFMESDISKQEIATTLCQVANTDVLTGFYSRIIYSRKLDELQKKPPKSLGVVFANVNGLKKVNSEFGYTKGDSHIKKAAGFLANHFKSDFYRISGDEFVSFFPDMDREEFEQRAVSLQESMRHEKVNLFALGHAWKTGKYHVLNMIEEADTVMYINKQEYYHSANISYHDITDNTLSDLLSCLDDNEFMIYLQPQVRLVDGSLHGAEALIRRFDKKTSKIIFPDQFIPLYEKKSIIRHIDIFVVEEVCRHLSKWLEIGKEMPISVNLSRVTLLEYGIVDTIATICKKYRVPHHLLVIEVTERVGLIENDVASSLIVDFVQQGFRISLDDFGCAYSNIVTLAQIDVDEVKLDKSLVDNLISSQKNHILVRNVLRMCSELENTTTLAEGIEDEEQGKLLHELGCNLGQGYFYSRPIPVSEFIEKYISS